MYVQLNDTTSAQQALLSQVGTAVLAMTIRDARNTAQQFQQIVEKADTTIQVVRDLSMGRSVDLIA